jgi:hypothetical protein
VFHALSPKLLSISWHSRRATTSGAAAIGREFPALAGVDRKTAGEDSMAAAARKRTSGKSGAGKRAERLAERVHTQQHTGNRDTPGRERRAGTRAGAENVERRESAHRSRRDRPVEDEADKDIKEGGMEQTVRRRSRRRTRG